MSKLPSVFLVSDIVISPCLSVSDPWSQLLVFLKGDSSLAQKQDWCGRRALFHFSLGFLRLGWSLILDPGPWPWSMILHCSIFLWIFFQCTAHRSLILDVTRQSCSIFCHVLFNCIAADAASLACLSISCTAGEQESHVMSEVEVQENKGGGDLIILKPSKLFNYQNICCKEC